MKRGEIWLVSLDPSVGHEQAGNRPVLIVSPDKFNPRDGGAWWAAVSGVAQSRTRLKRLSSSSGSSGGVVVKNLPAVQEK